jgi:hypothetical protein
MSDVDILKAVLANVPSGNQRRKEAVLWGSILGLTQNESLRIACDANLIPSTHPPQKAKSEKLLGKDRGSVDE